jgi:hypothetical protein
MKMQFVHNYNAPSGDREAVVLYDPLLREYHVRLMQDATRVAWLAQIQTKEEALATARDMLGVPTE